MKQPIVINLLFAHIGGGLLTNDWVHPSRRAAAINLNCARPQKEHR